MKEKRWIVRRDELLAALDILELVPAKLGVPSAEFYQITPMKNGKCQFMLSADATASVTIAGEGEWPIGNGRQFFLDRRVFVPFVRAALEIKNRNDFVFYGWPGKALRVKHGRRKAQFSHQAEIQGYAGLSHKGLSEKLEMSEHARGLIYCARNCASGDSLVPQLNCVYIRPSAKSMDIFATNQKILYKSHSKSKLQSSTPVPFPLFLVTLLGSEHLKAIEWKKGIVALKFDHGEIWQPVSSKAKAFPKKAIGRHIRIGGQKPRLFRVDARRFARVLARLGMYLQAVRRQDWVLTVNGKAGEGKITLYSTVSHSTFKETLKVKTDLRKDFAISWPLDMILPVFDYIGKKYKKTDLEVRLWEAKTKLGKKLASYIKTGDIELVIPAGRE